MANELTNTVSDSTRESNASKSTDASDKLMATALTLYDCGNGVTVSKRSDCFETNRHLLPELTIKM